MKAFSDKGNLTAHQFVHSGEKPHICPTCNQAFTRKSSLKRHIGKNHLSAEKPSPVKENSQE
jgi:KRAB domain-containing zinc finger protein